MSGSNGPDDSDDVPDLGPVPTRLEVDADTVRRLVAEQFPQWSSLPVDRVPQGGWDNWTFQLGDAMLVRLPSAAEYALAVEKEQRWLPELARQITLPIPSPLGLGLPGAGYPYPWSIYGWLPGERAGRGQIADPLDFARQLAGLVLELRGMDASDGPRPGLHNWYRGATLRTYDEVTRSSLATLDGLIDVQRVADLWSDALDAHWDGVDRWFHGDLAEGNLLLQGGRLSAVIDFGTCGVGDPSCDLAIAWTMLTPAGRRAFRARVRVDEATWARGRGWALWKTLRQYAAAVEDDDADEAAEPRRVLEEMLAESRIA